MIQKKRIASKTKSKPASKSPKRKSFKPPKATLTSIQTTLNQVVEKLGQHDQQFGQINQKLISHDQRFEKIEVKIEKMDDEVRKIRVFYENEMKPLAQSIYEKVESLESKIDTRFEDHETRISALESRPA